MEDTFFCMYDPNCPQCLTKTVFQTRYWLCKDCGLALLTPLNGQVNTNGQSVGTPLMQEPEGKTMGEPGKNSRESKPRKLFIKLPPNYLELPPDAQKEWREQLAQTILEHHKK